MPDKEGNIVPGEPEHYRYFKDKNATGAGKVTGIDSMKEAKSPVKPEDKDNAYSKEQAKGLNRDEQEEILTKRKIDFDKKDKENDMIKKILKSNPEE